ncbi:imelysin family protein [Leptospira ognonensis]|uniref:imelysin family protein n=1 Tax=Leptospira ognonensis TaxID=2484945 RepID=UPI0014386340|nr:imelysin family protein [Leptospira ognonensis]
MKLISITIKINSFNILLIGLSFVFLTIGNCTRNRTEITLESLLNGSLYTTSRTYDTTAIFSNLGNNVILAGYTSLSNEATTFKTAADSYSQNCANTTALQNLQDLWKVNFTKLKSIEIVQFGPAVQGGYYETIDPWPTSYLSNPADTSAINEFIVGSTTINTSNIASLNKLAKGLPAIEYLLFDDGTGNSSLISICNNLTGRRLSFLVSLISDYATNAGSLKNAWSETGGNFLKELTSAGLGSSFFETKKLALDSLITQMVTVLNNLVDKKLGYPSGLNIASGGTIRASAIESRYADASMDGLVANLVSLQVFYTGNGGAGISDYVRATNPILDRKIIFQIEEAISKSKQVSNLRISLTSNDLSKIRDAYEAIRALRITLTTDLSALSGTGTSTVTGDGD